MRSSVFCNESVDLCDLVVLVDLVREGISSIVERSGRNEMRSGRGGAERGRLLFGFDQRTRAAAVYRKLHVAAYQRQERSQAPVESQAYVFALNICVIKWPSRK